MNKTPNLRLTLGLSIVMLLLSLASLAALTLACGFPLVVPDQYRQNFALLAAMTKEGEVKLEGIRSKNRPRLDKTSIEPSFLPLLVKHHNTGQRILLIPRQSAQLNIFKTSDSDNGSESENLSL